MALPSSGSISIDDIKAELGITGELSLNDSRVMALAGLSSGSITLPNDLWGKSSGHSVSYNQSSLYASGYSSNGRPGTAITDAITATATGGSGNFTYRWTAVRQQGNVATQTGQTAQSVSFRISGGAQTNAVWDGYVYCTITDANSGLAVKGANIPCNMFVESSGGGGPIEIS